MHLNEWPLIKAKRKGKEILKVPVGSTSREILIASDVAISWLAGEIAKIIQFGCKTTSISACYIFGHGHNIFKTFHQELASVVEKNDVHKSLAHQGFLHIRDLAR